MTSETLERKVRARLDRLTKPKGSLGRLEEIALKYALIRGEEMPSPARKSMYIFCGDHGITAEGVSAYPADVTRQMIRNFLAGGAAINVLCNRLEIRPTIVDMGAAGPVVPGVLDYRIGPGTANFAAEPAMSRAQALQAIEAGAELARRAALNCDLTGIGEMGIGNTTSAAAILSAFTGADPSLTVGPGTGLESDAVRRKADVIRKALALHRPDPSDPVGVLACVGGFEIGAITGFLIGAWEARLPVVVDGFPCSAGALIANALVPRALDNVFWAHRSAEPGHDLMMRSLAAEPLLDLEMRLGEGTGAALAISIIDAAVRLYREMATFDEAGVADQETGSTVA